MNELRLALVQTDLQWQAAEPNRQLLQDLLLPLRGHSDLVILPEMFTSAFAMGAGVIENLAYVAGVNRIGRDGNNQDYLGHSAVIDPQGTEVLQADAQAGVFTTTLSLQTLRTWRETFPAWMDADEFMLR